MAISGAVELLTGERGRRDGQKSQSDGPAEDPGIRRRWLINSVGVVLLVLAMALGTFSAAMWSYYYSTTLNDLKRRAADEAGGFGSYTRSQYWTNAQKLRPAL